MSVYVIRKLSNASVQLNSFQLYYSNISFHFKHFLNVYHLVNDHFDRFVPRIQYKQMI